MSSDLDISTFEKFKLGPSILKVKIPKEILNNLNEYCDKVIADSIKSESLNWGNKLVGDVSQEFKVEPEFVMSSGFYKFLAECVGRWIFSETNKNITKFEIKNTWVVRQFENEYNPTHWHSAHVSGAGFLKLPEEFGKHYQQNKSKEYRGGNLQLIHGSRMFLCHSIMNIVPKVGDFYFFPNYLMHSVFPFKGSNSERRSISFNASVDDKIYNIYGS